MNIGAKVSMAAVSFYLGLIAADSSSIRPNVVCLLFVSWVNFHSYCTMYCLPHNLGFPFGMKNTK